MQELFYDCPQCGDIGRISQLSEHPTRPMPTDLGFCPKCGADVEDLLSRDQITTVLLDYGEDPEAFFAALPTSEEAGA